MITKFAELAETTTNERRGALTTDSKPRVPDHVVKDLVKVFKLLSDETRLRVLLYLTQDRELHVRALCEMLDQSQPAVSHHLALLRVAGLIESRREGKHNFYHILPIRFETLLDTVFANVPKDQRRIRFEDYVLSYAPAGQNA
ncbi:MAG TPA: metalloregulator ArsR/SmtB family transcription factor [Pirellulales bacterium]